MSIIINILEAEEEGDKGRLNGPGLKKERFLIFPFLSVS